MDATVEGRPGGIAILRLHGRLDLRTSAETGRWLTIAVDGGFYRLVVDLAGVEGVDSSGLVALVGGLRAARQAGGDLRLVRLSDEAGALLAWTGLDRVFRTFPSVDEALADF